MQKLLKERKQHLNKLIIATIVTFIVSILLIVAMEGMIYGIYMDAIHKNTNCYYTSSSTVAYVEKSGSNYKVYYHNEGGDPEWCYQVIDQARRNELHLNVKEIKEGAPSPFVLSITPAHYVVISILLAGVTAFFVYKFVDLDKKFKKAKKKLEAETNPAE